MSLCYKFSSKGPALRILGLRAASPKFEGPRSRVLGVMVPYPRVPVPRFWVSGSSVPGSQIPRSQSPKSLGLRLRIPGSQISGPEIFSFWKPQISFTEMFHEILEKQFNWNLMLRCEFSIKLVFHEILWKKNFTVYPSLY